MCQSNPIIPFSKHRSRSLCSTFSLVLLTIALSTNVGSAETYVSGPVAGIWDLAGSPYIVTGSISILEDTNLEIQPGVIIRFNAQTDLWIYGHLCACGTEEEPIQWLAEAGEKWGGIQMIDADLGSHFNYNIFNDCHSNGETDQTVKGGAIYTEGSAPVIANCRFERCECGDWGGMPEDYGGAIYFNGGQPRVLDCEFIDCHQYLCWGGGGAISFSELTADLVITGCTFTDCHAHGYGGAIQGSGCDVDISHCEFRHCTVTHSAGAISMSSITGRLFNLLFVNCICGDFGPAAVSVSGGEITAAHCTVADNDGWSIDPVGAFQLYGTGSSRLCNSIFWGNLHNEQPSPVQLSVGDDVDVYFCDVMFGYPGGGNLDLDPLFAAEGDVNYCLSAIAAGQVANSPCIDAGYATVTDWELTEYSTRTDLAADTGTVDMGYHYQASFVSGVVDELVMPDLDLTAAPNPFRGGTTIRLRGALPENGYYANRPESAAANLQLFDLSGRLIRSLPPTIGAGDLEYHWDGRDNAGHAASPGAYFARLANGTPLPRGAGRLIVLR